MTDAAATNGRLAPQDLDAEESVLSAMLLSPAAIDSVRQELATGDFYRLSHGILFETLVGLRHRGEGTDAVLLAAELEQRGRLDDAGGKVRIHELAALVSPVSNARHYARVVARKARDRELLALLQPVVDDLWSGAFDRADVLERLARAATLIGGTGGFGDTRRAERPDAGRL